MPSIVPFEAKCSPARRSVARPDVGGEYRTWGDPGAFIGGRVVEIPLDDREGTGGGSSRLGRVLESGLLGARGGALTGEPAELAELIESECLSEGSDVSLAIVGLREGGMIGGESDP